MLYTPIERTKDVNWDKYFQANWERLKLCDKIAKAKEQLVGRYITEPIADGQAVYQIIRENKKTVRIRVCTGLGDDWEIPYWGNEASINKDYAISKISRRDAFESRFAKRT